MLGVCHTEVKNKSASKNSMLASIVERKQAKAILRISCSVLFIFFWHSCSSGVGGLVCASLCKSKAKEEKKKAGTTRQCIDYRSCMPLMLSSLLCSEILFYFSTTKQCNKMEKIKWKRVRGQERDREGEMEVYNRLLCV